MIGWLLNDLPLVERRSEIPDFGLFAIIIVAVFFIFMVLGSVLFTVGREMKQAEVSETIIKMRDRDEIKTKVDKEIEDAYYAEDDVKEEIVDEKEEEKEVDMKRISDEVKKKPPKTRTRSERRRKI